MATRLIGFDVKVLYHDPVRADPSLERDLHVTPVGFAELLSTADVLTIHYPDGEANHHLLGAPELGGMPPASILINTARGDIVDPDALLAALESGTLARVGLDVFETEPVHREDPLLGMDNVALSPHTAASILDNVPRVAHHAFENMLRVIHHEPIPAPDAVVRPRRRPTRAR